MFIAKRSVLCVRNFTIQLKVLMTSDARAVRPYQ